MREIIRMRKEDKEFCERKTRREAEEHKHLGVTGLEKIADVTFV